MNTTKAEEMLTFDLASYLTEASNLITEGFQRYLPSSTTFPQKLHEAMHYSLTAGGKRLRPALCFAGAEACGGGRREVLAIATALEIIHTFSLIHDDLPAMDNDDLRRGVPTNHKVFGEAIGILSGDALLAQAFLILAKEGLTQGRTSSRLFEIIFDIATATGSLGMVGGQAFDMALEGQIATQADVKKLHQLKTAKLIQVSVVSGAKMVSQSTDEIAQLEYYGEAIGMAFQIMDDLLDVEAGVEIGKLTHKDASKGKVTYPSVFGIKEAHEQAAHYVETALESIKSFKKCADPLRAIAQYIIRRKK